MTANSHHCFHCGLPNPPGSDIHADLLGGQQFFCCRGCQAVAEAICASGLTDYYRLRVGPGITAQPIPEDLQRYDSESVHGDAVRNAGPLDETTLLVDGIQCAACTWLLERHLGRLAGVAQVDANLGRRLLRVRWNPAQLQLSDLLRAIREVGYQPSLWSAHMEEEAIAGENRLALMRLGVAGIGMMQVGMYAVALHAGSLQGIDALTRQLLELASLMVATVVVFFAARPFFVGAWRGIRHLAPGMDVPVAGAIAIAYIASLRATLTGVGEVYYDSVSMFTFLLLLSRYLEMRSRLALVRQGERIPLPEFTLREEESGVVVAVAPGAVRVGDRLVIRPGERIPVDCSVTGGCSTVDDSLLTGEFLPRTVEENSELLAGSLNGDGLLRATASRTLSDSRAIRIVDMLGAAQARKLPIARLADSVASWFVVGVVLVAIGVFVYWWWHAPERALWITLSVLVVSCPCALSLATPTAITAALARLRRDGILVRNSDALERASRIDCIVFDKTGTLTEGRMTIARVDNQTGEQAVNLRLAAALESYSSHPVARAFRSGHSNLPPVSEPLLKPGAGVEGTIDGVRYRIGSAVYVGIDIPGPDAEYGIPVVLREVDGAVRAIYYLYDPPRPDAVAAVQGLRARSLSIHLFTGDTSGAADRIGQQLGITQIGKGMAPEDKLDKLEELSQCGHHVMAVGDGVNDVLLLAAADLSVAVDTSIEITRHTADVVLFNPALRALESLLDCGSRLRRTIRQNLGWALFYNVSAIPLAAAGLVPPWLAVIGMSASSLVVVANALRLARSR